MSHLHAAEHVRSDHSATRDDKREKDEARRACGEREEREERERKERAEREERKRRERVRANAIVLGRQKPVQTDPAALSACAAARSCSRTHEQTSQNAAGFGR